MTSQSALTDRFCRIYSILLYAYPVSFGESTAGRCNNSSAIAAAS